jgi:sulfonate transport system substrate-binding protein
MRGRVAAAALTILMAIGGAHLVRPPSPAGAQPPQIPTIRVQYIVPVDQMISLFDIPQIQGTVLKHWGKRYRMELGRAQGTPFLVAAMAAGEADIAFLAYNSFASAVIKNVVPGGLTIVGSDFYDSTPDYFNFHWLALAEAPINGVKDLKGKKIGVLAIGTGADATTRLMLKKSGLDPVKDVTIVEIPAPAMEEALRSRRIDAGFLAPVFYYKAMAAGGMKTVFDSHQAWGKPYVFSFIVARNEYLKKSPDAVRAFLDDYVTMLRYVQKPENRDAVIDMVAAHFKASKPLLQQFYLTKKDMYRRPDARIVPEDLQHAISRLFELGFLDKDVPVAQYVDNSYLPR